MRKTQIIQQDDNRFEDDAKWLDLEEITRVEISSEDDLFPIEHAVGKKISTGWRAAATGPQIVRLVFDNPQELHRIQIHIVDRAAERTQEIGVYVEMAGMGLQELRRQQFTFSPHGPTEEIEDFIVELAHVTAFELRIDPDRSHKPEDSQNYASLASLRLA